MPIQINSKNLSYTALSNESVIDNENVILLNQLQQHLPNTTRASIAVGYFFISGFAPIMDSFSKIEGSGNPDHVIRLLISPVTNRLTAEALLASNESFEYAQRKASTSIIDGKSIAKEQIRDSLGHMPQSLQDQKVVTKLVSLIRQKKLQVRVYTKERLHAKAYIFELDNPQLPRMSIVGSSNLSISGIKENTELNLRTNVDNDSEKLLEWFDRHWEEAEEFTEDMADVMDDSWITTRTPEEVYQKAALHEHGTLDEIDVRESGHLKLFEFQKMAVANAISKINEYGGVIIADVVGTGKSYIGSMILKYLKENNRSKPLIICPPHLIDMWEKYMDEFRVDAKVLSRYKIGMEDNILQQYTNCDVVLVDESHNFRNRNNAYEALYSFMEQQPDDSCIIMLTATPISNSVNDLKNQLTLFPADSISNVPPLGNDSLDEYFKGVEQDHQLTQEGEDKIRDLLRYILIRRTRKQIQDNFAKKDGDRYYLESESGRKYFPKRNLNNPQEYDIDKVYQNSFERIQEYIESLKLARYTPGEYIKKEYRATTHPEYKKYNDLLTSMISLTGIVRTVLLKRMESSIAAFTSSVNNYAKGSDKFLEYLKDGIVPIGKDYQDRIYKSIMYDDEQYDSDDEPGKSAYDIEAFDTDQWKTDIISDIAVFEKMLKHLPNKEKFHRDDDKLHTLLKILQSRRGEKILLFTESRITAIYIYDYLKEKIPDVKIGQIDSMKSTKDKNSLICKFDPENNNSDVTPKNQLDILVSTDVLSEGVNLQAGKTVINYDFHWNPVRLIQRVGRIDRIGSKHDTVDVINFLPTTKIEEHLHLKERVATKIETIRKIIGHDQKILETSEIVDKDAVIDIYSGQDGVLDEATEGLLDIIQTASEIDAESIRGNTELKKQTEALPLGIRSATGSRRLLVACEADERMLLDDDVVHTKTFRRYYLVDGDVVTKMTASSFLKEMRDNSKKSSVWLDSQHEDMLNVAWKKFTRDVKNEQAKKRTIKLQTYFERKLRGITEDHDLGLRAKKIMPEIMRMMVTNRQPYRNLHDLRKRINKDSLDDKTILEQLESIFKNTYHYHKDIGKPRIIYSMRIQ